MTDGKAGDVYRLVFELTARATDVPYEKFLDELVDGLAAHYKADICRLHIGEAVRAAASSDKQERLAGVRPDDLSRFDTIDNILAAEVRRDGVLRTALDLDGGEEIVNVLARAVRTPETFAFPLMARGKAFGAITLYLKDPYPFEEADVRGLQAIGNVLYAASNKAAPPSGRQAKAVPVTLGSDKLRAYQETLDRVGKILDELLFLTDARNILLLDAQGDFIAKRGDESAFASNSFATVVASGFAAARRLSSFYGAPELLSLLHEGDKDDVFIIEVAERALLCVVYRDHKAPELITRWAQSAANRLAEHYDALAESRVL
jgi:predicted regulator of Ras-like GTPase activity (Roadblock/LC7/MglB family)